MSEIEVRKVEKSIGSGKHAADRRVRARRVDRGAPHQRRRAGDADLGIDIPARGAVVGDRPARVDLAVRRRRRPVGDRGVGDHLEVRDRRGQQQRLDGAGRVVGRRAAGLQGAVPAAAGRDDLDRFLLRCRRAARGGDLEVVGVAVPEILPVVLPEGIAPGDPAGPHRPLRGGGGTRDPCRFSVGDVVEVVKVVVEELRGVAVDPGLGCLVGGVARNGLPARLRLTRDQLGEADRERGEKPDRKDDQHHRLAGLVAQQPQEAFHEGGVSRRVAVSE